MLGIPDGNLMLLHDDNIEDKYKDQECVVVGKHPQENVYDINVNGLVCTFN